MAQTLRAVRAIRGGTLPAETIQGTGRRFKISEDIHIALEHVCSAIECIVEWMEQEARPNADATQLIANLRKAGDSLARSAAEYPPEMVLEKEDLTS
jgi:hypothetical protein